MPTDNEIYEHIFPHHRELEVALAHYWLVTWRGGEKVVEAIAELFPRADLYTMFYQDSVCGKHLDGHQVYSSSLDHALLRKQYQKLFPLYPRAVRSLSLQREYDLLISSESGPIKGIRKNSGILPHLCYIHTPMRYCWGGTDEYLTSLPRLLRPLARREFEKLRKYDETTIDNVDWYIANSHHVQNRVKDYYKRSAEVIYPPITDELFCEKRYEKKRKGEYYVSFGALTPYKRIDLIVEAFNRNRQRLIVIGEGSERKRLEALAEENITFYGSAEWSLIEETLLGAKALLFPGIEDFGMIPLEVMAYGLPVIAYGKGGALETVVEKEGDVVHSTGLFFSEQTSEALNAAVDRFESIARDFDPAFIASHAAKFRTHEFKIRFLKFVKEHLDW